MKATYSSDGEILDLPVGSAIIKTFITTMFNLQTQPS